MCFNSVMVEGLTSVIQSLFFVSQKKKKKKKSNPKQLSSLIASSFLVCFTYLHTRPVTAQKVGQAISYSKHINSSVEM